VERQVEIEAGGDQPILDGAEEHTIARYYAGKFQKSALIDGAFEAEDFFPAFGAHGRWLYFTAAPLRDDDGNVIGAIETLQDFTDRRRAEAALRESEERYRLLSITDGLTKLYNSRSFHDQLGAETARALRYGHQLSLLVLDVDDFKQFNDRYGHLEGDCVLVKLAQVIRRCLRRGDSAYRLGGEEFVVLLPETGVGDALQVAERVRNSFAATPLMPAANEVVHVTVSIGVTEFRSGEATADFFRRGDANMYLAKQQGKNRVAGDL
jgi:diguanylate cyclase (GGDEF)-like protein